MVKTLSRLGVFLAGPEWSSKWARISLPVLVRWVEQQRGKPDQEIAEFTYKDLANAVGRNPMCLPSEESLAALLRPQPFQPDHRSLWCSGRSTGMLALPMAELFVTLPPARR
jgi:hypothetical protein